MPAAIVARELGIKLIETICVQSYTGTSQGDLMVLKTVAPKIIALGGGQGVRGARGAGGGAGLRGGRARGGRALERDRAGRTAG